MTFEKAVNQEIKKIRERLAMLMEVTGFNEGTKPQRGWQKTTTF